MYFISTYGGNWPLIITKSTGIAELRMGFYRDRMSRYMGNVSGHMYLDSPQSNAEITRERRRGLPGYYLRGVSFCRFFFAPFGRRYVAHYGRQNGNRDTAPSLEYVGWICDVALKFHNTPDSRESQHVSRPFRS